MGRQGFGALVSDDQWTHILRAGTARTFADGNPIIRQGECEDVVYMLAEGTVKVTAHRDAGGESLLALRGAGEALGEFAALSGLPRTATVTASGGPCLTRALTGRLFRKLVDELELGSSLWAHVVLRQTEGESLRAEIAALPSRQRLAAALLRLSDLRSGATGARRDVVLKVGLSQREIGELIGLSRASVTSEFARLRAEEVILTGRRYIAIRDVDRLRRAAEDGSARG